MSKPLLAQVQYDLNGLMSAVRMGQIGLPETHPPSSLEGEDWGEGAGIPLSPFKWDQDRRAVLRADLDAYCAQLYGLTEGELRYILDPKDIHGQDFPSETFRVLKEKETRKYGEYRTKRLVLEAWNQLQHAINPNEPHNPLLDPPSDPPTDETGTPLSLPKGKTGQPNWPPQIHAYQGCS